MFDLYFFAQKTLQSTLPGPHRNRLKRFRDLFCFSQRYSILKFENCMSTQSTTMQTWNFSHRSPTILILLNYCYWICKHTQVLFSPYSSFKICETQSLLCPRSHCCVRIVIAVSTQSLLCPHSHCCVRVVIAVSTESLLCSLSHCCVRVVIAVSLQSLLCSHRHCCIHVVIN